MVIKVKAPKDLPITRQKFNPQKILIQLAEYKYTMHLWQSLESSLETILHARQLDYIDQQLLRDCLQQALLELFEILQMQIGMIEGQEQGLDELKKDIFIFLGRVQTILDEHVKETVNAMQWQRHANRTIENDLEHLEESFNAFITLSQDSSQFLKAQTSLRRQLSSKEETITTLVTHVDYLEHQLAQVKEQSTLIKSLEDEKRVLETSLQKERDTHFKQAVTMADRMRSIKDCLDVRDQNISLVLKTLSKTNDFIAKLVQEKKLDMEKFEERNSLTELILDNVFDSIRTLRVNSEEFKGKLCILAEALNKLCLDYAELTKCQEQSWINLIEHLDAVVIGPLSALFSTLIPSLTFRLQESIEQVSGLTLEVNNQKHIIAEKQLALDQQGLEFSSQVVARDAHIRDLEQRLTCFQDQADSRIRSLANSYDSRIQSLKKDFDQQFTEQASRHVQTLDECKKEWETRLKELEIECEKRILKVKSEEKTLEQQVLEKKPMSSSLSNTLLSHDSPIRQLIDKEGKEGLLFNQQQSNTSTSKKRRTLLSTECTTATTLMTRERDFPSVAQCFHVCIAGFYTDPHYTDQLISKYSPLVKQIATEISSKTTHLLIPRNDYMSPRVLWGLFTGLIIVTESWLERIVINAKTSDAGTLSSKEHQAFKLKAGTRPKHVFHTLQFMRSEEMLFELIRSVFQSLHITFELIELKDDVYAVNDNTEESDKVSAKLTLHNETLSKTVLSFDDWLRRLKEFL